jgi:hypothetical protein
MRGNAGILSLILMVSGFAGLASGSPDGASKLLLERNGGPGLVPAGLRLVPDRRQTARLQV